MGEKKGGAKGGAKEKEGIQAPDMDIAIQNFIVRAGEVLADGLFILCFNHAR